MVVVLLACGALVVGCEPEEREFRPQSAGSSASSSGGAATEPPSDAGAMAEDEPREAIERGRAQFARNCSPCHAQNGQGLIGPNLTDGVSIHEATSAADYNALIRDGVPARGMPGWAPSIGQSAVDDLAIYVWSLRHTNVSGRPAQGSYRLPR